MKFTFFKVIVGTLIVLAPANAMYDMQEEGKTAPSQAKLSQQSTAQKEGAVSALFRTDVSFENFPDDPFVSVCSFLDVRDLGRIVHVSTHLKKLTENPAVWRYMGRKYYGDYLDDENLREDPKQKVISHYLSVLMNTKTDLKEIESLVRQYGLSLCVAPFNKHIDLSFLLEIIKDHSIYEELIAQGNQNAITRKMEGLSKGDSGYQQPSVAARKFNELLIEKGDQKAIQRKVEGLGAGKYGYEKDPLAATALNEFLIEKGNLQAIIGKIEALIRGGDIRGGMGWYLSTHSDRGPKGTTIFSYFPDYGYKKDPVAAREFIESLSISETPIVRATGKYMKGFAIKYGITELGYEKDSEKAIEFIKQNHVPF